MSVDDHWAPSIGRQGTFAPELPLGPSRFTWSAPGRAGTGSPQRGTGGSTTDGQLIVMLKSLSTSTKPDTAPVVVSTMIV
jgi:hypothetical protein